VTVRRGIAWSFVVFGVLIISLASYLAFVDLGRHKTRIESLVSDLTGREFVIAGKLRIELFPSVSLVAEDARLANAEWASKQPMIEVGRLAANVGLWSLVSGTVDVRSFELSDGVVLLERGRGDEANWRFREPRVVEEPPPEPETGSEPPGNPLPVVIAKAKLRDVRVIYRERGKRDRVIRLDKLSIEPGKDELLALEGRGKLNEFPITLDGQAGPLESLLKGRDIRLDMRGSLGRLALDIKGSFGRLVPLEGADLRIKAQAEDVDGMLTRLELPLFVTGGLEAAATLAPAGERTGFDLTATAGDLGAKASGTLSGLQLRGSHVKFEATAADAARLAQVFGIRGIPAGPLSARGVIRPLRREIRFDELQAQLAGITATVNGRFIRGHQPKAELAFDVTVEDLAVLHASLPSSRFAGSGTFSGSREKLEVTGLAAALDDNRFTGRLSTTRAAPRRIEANLGSPYFDLTPFLPARAQPAESAQTQAVPKGNGKDEPRKKFLFGEEPLPILELKGTEANLHVAVAELAIANKLLKEVDSTVIVDHAHVTITARARGSLEGAVESSITVEPVGDDSAKVNLKFGLENVRAGLDMKEMALSEVPQLGVSINLSTSGRSMRELASNANGLMVLTQGPGKTKAEFLDAFGGNLLAELRGRLNPFRAQDPFTKLDCTVVRAEVVNGAVTIKPVLLQTQKVTVVAQGKIDLHTESLDFDFDTRPRKGIGVSPGMFANPFIRVEGTLAHPRLALGARGVTSGAVAAATGGLSVLASGLVDRLKGEADMCRKAREKAVPGVASAVNAAPAAVPPR
jgi:uncharacterized protein involved in outer membrane biogenesis